MCPEWKTHPRERSGLLKFETPEVKACSAEMFMDMSIFPYRSVPSTDSEESFRSGQGVAGVQTTLMMIQAPEPVVEYIQPAPQVQYAQPKYLQPAPAVEQFSVTNLHGRATGRESLGVAPSQRLPTRSCNRFSRTCRAERIKSILECHGEAVPPRATLLTETGRGPDEYLRVNTTLDQCRRCRSAVPAGRQFPR